jgi:hypothetical protein
MAKIQIELPDATVKTASDAGLMTPQALDRLLTRAGKLPTHLVAAAGVKPMSSRCRWRRSTRR